MSGCPEQRLYAVVVRARDLPRMRRFYSQVVGLGEPVVDSNFWVEFQSGEGANVLALVRAPVVPGAQEASQEAADRPGECRVAACLVVENLQRFRSRLDEADVRQLGTVRLPSGARGVYFSDPEGNMVLAVERCATAEDVKSETGAGEES